MIIKEHLNKLDIASDNKYDLYTLYECIDFTADERKDFHDILEQEEDAEVIYKHLVNRFDNRDFSSIREDVNDFEYIADEFPITGPEYRGARMPEFNEHAFNISAIPDNMRPKYYHIEPGKLGVKFTWMTQEPFSLNDIHKFIDEVERSFTAFCHFNHIYDLFPVNVEIEARDGAEYGYYAAPVYIDTRDADVEEVVEEDDAEMVLDEAFDEIYTSEYSALDDDIEILYDRYHNGKESPADILTDLGYKSLEDNDMIYVMEKGYGDTSYTRKINLTTLDTSPFITYAAYVNDEIPEGFTISKTNLYESLENDNDKVYIVVYKDNSIDEYECLSHQTENEAEIRAERLSKNKSKYSDIRIEELNIVDYREFLNSDKYFDFMETGEIK